MKQGKRINEAYKNVDKNKMYDLDAAIKLIKENVKAKFDETVEVSINLGLDTKKSDQTLRGVVSLPHGTGKTVRVAVFARGEKLEEAKAAGADLCGAEDLMEKVLEGEMGFDVAVATPDMMGVVGRLAKILGPRGLMPNPKLGTVTPDVKNAVIKAKSGQVQYRAEAGGIVHGGIGKLSFEADQIKENIKTFVDAIVKAKPSGAKGVYLQKISLSTTQGPGVKINIASVS